MKTDPSECRQNAEDALRDAPDTPLAAIAWAILALAGEVAETRREQARQSRRRT